MLQKRHNGDGGLMVWASFGWNKKSDIVFIDGKINSAAYTNIFENRLVPFAHQMASHEYIFQKDNASVHVSKASKLWFAYQNITLLDLPSLSSDLNPMENM